MLTDPDSRDKSRQDVLPDAGSVAAKGVFDRTSVSPEVERTSTS